MGPTIAPEGKRIKDKITTKIILVANNRKQLTIFIYVANNKDIGDVKVSLSSIIGI